MARTKDNRMDEAEFEARMSRIRIAPYMASGEPGVHVQVMPTEPDDEYDHGSVSFLVCGRGGLPFLGEDNRLDLHHDGEMATRHGYGSGHRLVRWLSGREAWAEATDDLAEVHPEDTARALVRLRSDIAMAVRDAGFPAVFVEGMATVGLWVRGPFCDVASLFGDDKKGEGRRAFVRENPFLSEVAFRNLAWRPGDSGNEPRPLPVVPEETLARFRVAPWTDLEARERLMADLHDGEAQFLHRVVEALPGLTPETVPSDYEGMRAMCSLLAWAEQRRGHPWTLDPGVLVRGITDWAGLERDMRKALSAAWQRDHLESLLAETLGPVADSFAQRVLLPIRARTGTLQGFAGDELPKELRRTAMAILFGQRNLRGCLDVVRAEKALRTGVAGVVPGEGVPGGRSWEALFPVTRRDGFVLRCLVDEESLASAGYRSDGNGAPSVRALAASGWVQAVAVSAFTPDGALRQVARAVVHWSSGRWDDVDAILERAGWTDDGDGVDGLDLHSMLSFDQPPSPEATSGLAALRAHLATLPDAPRPSYAPIAPDEMVQDLCGYDFRDTALLERVVAAYAPVLPQELSGLASVEDALRRGDLRRAVPSRRRKGWPGYMSFRFRNELGSRGGVDEGDE